MRILILPVLTLMAAACGSGTRPNESGPVNQTNAVTAQASGLRIAALSEGQRNAVFIRAIRDAGLDCQQVTGSVPAPLYRDRPVWTATCRGGGRWTLVIGADEVVQILDPEEARLVRERPGNGQ